MTIATSEAIADTGATSIFIMEGMDVRNKRPATKPLTINLPDGRQIKSTHICDVDIPGLPTTLTGHIVPHLAIASLFGIRVLCKAGCKVIFDNDKCDVCYKGKLILRGYKDPSTDLWTLPIVPSPIKAWTTPGITVQGPHVQLKAASARNTCISLRNAVERAITRGPVKVNTLPRPGPCIGRAPHRQKLGNCVLCIPLVQGSYPALIHCLAFSRVNPSWWFILRQCARHVLDV